MWESHHLSDEKEKKKRAKDGWSPLDDWRVKEKEEENDDDDDDYESANTNERIKLIVPFQKRQSKLTNLDVCTSSDGFTEND